MRARRRRERVEDRPELGAAGGGVGRSERSERGSVGEEKSEWGWELVDAAAGPVPHFGDGLYIHSKGKLIWIENAILRFRKKLNVFLQRYI